METLTQCRECGRLTPPEEVSGNTKYRRHCKTCASKKWRKYELSRVGTRDIPAVKICTYCGIQHPAEAFLKRAASADGLQNRCRNCRAAYRKANIERRREANREYQRERAKKRQEDKRLVTPHDIAHIHQRGCAHAHYGDCNGELQLDHIVPITRGGRHTIGNLQALCETHNQSKSTRLEIEVRWYRNRMATHNTQ